MPTLLEADPGTDTGVFSDLIGGENGAPAYQVVAGRFSEVPKAEPVTPLDLGAFADMVPGPGKDVEMPAVEQDLGIFQALVPPSPTAESEKALAETPKPPDPAWIGFEKGIENVTGQPFHQIGNAIRVFGQTAGRYIFDGMQAFERNRAQYYQNPTPEAYQAQGDQILLPDGSRMSPEEEAALEQKYKDELAKHAPAALENAATIGKVWDKTEASIPTDPTLADTVPARLAAAAGPVAVMTAESLIPEAGLPWMVMHGALATEQEALDAGATPEQAKRAAIRSAIGLGIFGGASKIAAASVAKALPWLVKDPSQLTRFVAQFTGQEAANETSSRVIQAWNAAADAPEGQKLQAAVGAATETNLENTVMNTMYALAHAAKASRGTEKPPISPASEPVPAPAPESGRVPETPQGAEPAREPGPVNQASSVDEVIAKYAKTDVKATEPPLKDTVFRVMSPDEWNHITKGGEYGPGYSGGLWSSDPSEYSGHLSEGDVIAAAPTKGFVQYRGLPQKELIETGRQHYNNADKKAINDITAAYQMRNGKLVKIHEGGGEPNAVQIRSAEAQVPRAPETGQNQPGDREGVRPSEQGQEAARTPGQEEVRPGPLVVTEEPGGGIRASRERETVPMELVPEHLRRAPEVERLLSEPAATVKPEMKMARAGEGGALFSRGGARATVIPKGTTPKGDTNFLRIEPGYKRLASGLERKGAADVLADTKNKVGRLLSEAARKHVDTEQEIFGQLYSKFDHALPSDKRTANKAFDEIETFLAAKENGRPVPVLSPSAQKILTAWEDVAESTGNLARANSVQVFDPKIGGHRPMGSLGRNYLPRMFKPEVERVMRDPKQNPTLWNTLVDEFAKHKGITDVEAAKELRAEAGRFSSTDFMGNMERARTGQLPEIFYDYDLRRVASHYIPQFSERMAQIIAYGQRLGPREAPQRQNLWDIARGEAENDYTQRWLNAAEDQAVNLRSKTASGTGMARAQTLASGLLLSSPTTSVMRNTLSGLASTAEVMGIRRSIAPLASAMSKAARSNAKEMGAVRENIGDFFHADKLGETVVDDVVRAVTDKALKFSGYNGSEVFVRTHAALAASSFAKDGVAALVKNPASMRSKEFLAMAKRMGVDPMKIFGEGADWKTGPETRKFIRTVIRDSQGGYKFDQVPLWANSNLGRFFYQFGRWGTQRARNIWQNGIKPAIGEEVKWAGKTMTRRDLRPLAKMAGSAVLLGEAFAGVAGLLFGRDRRDASLHEIAQAWDEDKKMAFGLAAERAVNDIIMAGMLGIWGQPIDFLKGLKDQSRLKNPMEPPGLGSTKAILDLGQAALDQNGELTKNDLLKFAGNVAPGAKQLSDVARNVMDEPLYEAQNDLRTLRASAQRWAKREGMDVSPRVKGDFRKSELAPTYEPIKEALLVGDAQTAKVLVAEFLNKQTEKGSREKAIKSLKASIKASQPFRAGPYTATQYRTRFDAWARKNLSEDDYLQTKRIQERYVRAASKAGLW